MNAQAARDSHPQPSTRALTSRIRDPITERATELQNDPYTVAPPVRLSGYRLRDLRAGQC